MASHSLDALPKLPPANRAQLAMAPWESLDDEQRESQFTLNTEQAAELERRLGEHLSDPASAVPREKVREKLLLILSPGKKSSAQEANTV